MPYLIKTMEIQPNSCISKQNKTLKTFQDVKVEFNKEMQSQKKKPKLKWNSKWKKNLENQAINFRGKTNDLKTKK